MNVNNCSFGSVKSALIKIILVFVLVFGFVGKSFSTSLNRHSFAKKLDVLEQKYDGRIGVYAYCCKTKKILGHRSAQRFAMCSTSKFMIVSTLLKKNQEGAIRMDSLVAFTQADRDAGYAPISTSCFDKGMRVSQLCEAALEYSDNSAANALLGLIGGPKAVTTFARSTGDRMFRLDRTEPTLNSSIPGDVRDTTTPEAMVMSLRRILLGNVLGETQKEMLTDWMKRNTTGNQRIRAGVPASAVVADKTGSGDYGTQNDIGVVWLNNKKDILVISVYFNGNKKSSVAPPTLIGDVTKLVMNYYQSGN